ncbi:MAG: hypothetical protein LBE09_02080 [Christensenellaceae bacterium]|jgi:hypothetical protein|nr:hypothetical protein [Christensenellaceae bacterium]
MNILGRLEEIFGVDEPILLNEIRVALPEYSPLYIFQCIRKAIGEGKLVRYSKTLYYIPSDNFGGKCLLNPRKVIEKKIS